MFTVFLLGIWLGFGAGLATIEMEEELNRVGDGTKKEVIVSLIFFGFPAYVFAKIVEWKEERDEKRSQTKASKDDPSDTGDSGER